MMYVDTHVVAWLYYGKEEYFSQSAVAKIEENDLLISPMVSLELQFLREIGKVKDPSSKILSIVKRDFGINVSDLSFAKTIEQSVKEKWTRDPFDRIIVAQAKSEKALLLSKDRNITKNYTKAVW